MVVMGPVFVIFNIGFFAFLCQADSKTAVMAGGYGSAAAVQGRNFCVINKLCLLLTFYADVYDITNRFDGPIC